MKIRKLLITLTVILIAMCFFGCSTNKYQKNYDLGIKYLEQGDYENAIISLNAAIEIDPKEDACFALGETYYKVGNYEKVFETVSLLYERHGAYNFEKRVGYYSYSSMEKEQQQYIEKIVNGVINNNHELIFDVFKDKTMLQKIYKNEATGHFVLYTIWDKYKINIVVYSYDVVDIEIRVENGTGYAYSMDLDNDSYCYYIYRMCQCVNWQWNGEINKTLHREDGNQYSDQITVGTMHNNVKDGDFRISIHDYSDEYDWSFDILNVYQNGTIIEEDGVPSAKNTYLENINDISVYSDCDLTSEAYHLYW